MDDAAYEALMARLNEAYPSQPAYTPADVKLQSGQITRQQGQDPVMLMNPRTLQQGESNPIDFDQSGGIGQLGAMINAGRLRGMLDMSAQDGMTPGYNAMATMQLPEGYSASYRRSNEIGGLGDAQNAIMLAKQFGEPNTPSPSLSAGASRSGMNGPITYDLSGSVPLTTGRNPEAPQFRLPSSREEQPMVPPSRRDRERQPSRQEVKGAATAGLSHSPRDHSTRANAGLKFNFADGGHVDAAMHLLRQHFDEGGFLSSLSNLFSGPDYLSSGKEASFANMPTQDETNADFFKADRALRLAQQAQAPQPERRPVIPERVVEEAPRLRAVAPATEPTTRPQISISAAPLIGPYDFGHAVSGQQVTTQMLPHFQERPGFGQVLLNNKTNWADAQPEVSTSNPQKYMLPKMQPAASTIPDAAAALAAVEKLHNAGVYSGPELDAAGQILQAHITAKEDNIPVEEALHRVRAMSPVPRAAIPANVVASAPVAYSPEPEKSPARAAIDEATGKMTARAPQGPDLNDRQRDLIIRTIAAETSGKTPEESQAIAHVILNRIQSGKYGASPEAVLFARKQFEPWSNPNGANYPMRFSPESRRYGLGQTALDAALGAEDITNGATNFWAPKAQAALGRRPPKWGRTGGVDVGETRFHNLSRAEGGVVDDALHVVRERHADGEAVGQGPVAMDNSERVRAAESAANLARQIQAYEASMASIRQQPQDIQSMTHAPEKPRAPISVEALGKNREFGSAPYDVAGPLSSFAQGAYDMKTLPLYMYPPTARVGMAIDTAEGVASGSPTQVAMGALGGPLKVARNVIAPLAVASGVTAPDEAEAARAPKIAAPAIRASSRATTPAADMTVDQALDIIRRTSSAVDPKKDPRFWHNISSNKLATPLDQMTAEYKATEPKFTIPVKTPSDYEGKAFISAAGDPTLGGVDLIGVNGQKLINPTKMQAGPSFTYGASAQGPDKSVWASDLPIMTAIGNRGKKAYDAGFDPYLNYIKMSGESPDYSHHISDTLLDLFKQSKVTDDAVTKFDTKMREGFSKDYPAYPDWPGLNAPNLDDYLYKTGPGKSRTAMAKLMASGTFQKLGMPDVASVRYAVTEPRLLHSPNYSSGSMIARMDPLGKSIRNPAVPHKTYAAQFAAHPEGADPSMFSHDVPLGIMHNEWVKEQLAKRPDISPSNLQYIFARENPTVYWKPENVDRVSKFLDLKQRGLIP